jgi:hypothetical protein
LNNVGSLPTLTVELFHKKSGIMGGNLPMGLVDIPLDSIPQDGNALTAWYPLTKSSPKMKDISGEVCSD